MTSTASNPAAPTAAARAELAPTGKLRAGINFQNQMLTTLGPNGEQGGVAVELVRELAALLVSLRQTGEIGPGDPVCLHTVRSDRFLVFLGEGDPADAGRSAAARRERIVSAPSSPRPSQRISCAPGWNGCSARTRTARPDASKSRSVTRSASGIANANVASPRDGFGNAGANVRTAGAAAISGAATGGFGCAR